MFGCLWGLTKFTVMAGSIAVITVQPAARLAESAIYWGFKVQSPRFGQDWVPQFTFIHTPSLQEVLEEVVPEPIHQALGGWKLTDKEIICAIGASEGTRGKDCSPNKAYYGHTDPGNGKWNMGTFSYQHGAATPEEADASWLPTLRKAENDAQARTKERFGEYLSPKASVAFLDAYTQSPHASWFYLSYLPSANPSFDEIVEARTKALKKSRSIYPGSRMNVRADQERRMRRVWEQVHR